jgi:alkyl sulfatase BDS1-like metallo-beta-lactamase superfamily hydrolase
MATVAECETAMHDLAARLAGADAEHRRKADLDRTLSCTLPDLQVTFAGHLHDGQLDDIRQVDSAAAQVRLTLSSDDLVKLVAGDLSVGQALISGRLRIDAGMLDLLKLRSIF